MLFRIYGIESLLQIVSMSKVKGHGRDTIYGIHAQIYKKLQTPHKNFLCK